MRSFKGLDLRIDEALRLIKKWIEENAPDANIEVEEESDNLWQVEISIPGQEKAKLRIFLTKKGTTIDPTIGKNKELSHKIAKFIASNSNKSRSINKTFENISGEVFDQFRQQLKDAWHIDVIDEREEDSKTFLRLKGYGNFHLALHYYKTSNRLLIQGKTSPLYYDVLALLMKGLDASRLADAILESADLGPIELFPEEEIENELEGLLGKEVYHNGFLLQDAERNWLKTSLFLFKKGYELPEYYPLVAGPLKIIEGILRRILIHRLGNKAFPNNIRHFTHFDKQQNGNYVLKEHFRRYFSDEEIQYVEECYNFLKKYRDVYSHNLGITQEVISNIDEAWQVFQLIIKLIKNGIIFAR